MTKPLVAFIFGVLCSELTQLGTWKAGNHDKPWRQWFMWGLPHFLSNLAFVVVTYLLWDAQYLDDVIAWGLGWFGLGPTMQWDQLLAYNIVQGFTLGAGTDMFGDKLGHLARLLWPTIMGKLGAIGNALKPPPATPPAGIPPAGAEGIP